MRINRTKRVLHIFRAPVGGLFRHVCDLALAQSDQGCSVGVICDSMVVDELSEKRLTKLGNELSLGLHRIPMARNLGLEDWQSLRRVSDIVREIGPDILHGHGAKGGAFCRLLRGRHRSVFYTPHLGTLQFAARSAPVVAERLFESRTAGLVFESRYAADQYAMKVRYPRCAWRVVYNGLHASEFQPVAASEDAADFLFIGELRRRKGADLFIDSLARIARSYPVSACIVGSGAEEQNLKRMAKERLNGSVRFLPPMKARDAFKLARCVVMPSRDESMPYVVLEAIAAKKPLIASSVGGIPEIFGDQRDSLVKADDAISLTDSMERFLERPDRLRQSIGELALQIRNTFSVEQMTESVLDFYASAN